MDDDHDGAARVASIVMLGLVVITAVIGLTFVAVLTDRDLFRAEAFTFGGAVMLAGLGGISWWGLRRRRRWHVSVDRDEPEHEP